MDKANNRSYLALGSNIETASASRFDFLCFALKELERNNVSLHRVSSVYETLPYGFTDQENFLNAVVEIETNCNAFELLKLVKSIEEKSGRIKTIENGPRTLDIDILLFENNDIVSEELNIPHKSLFERAFVLVPLSDLAPDIVGNIEKYDLVDDMAGVKKTEYDLNDLLQDKSAS